MVIYGAMKQDSFTYYHPITIRYADLDPQGHVNNAVYMTYLESARLGYYEAAGIWDPGSGEPTGLVVARAEIEYLEPIYMGQSIQVGVRLESLGTSSLTFIFQIEATPGGRPMARGKTVMVAFDSRKNKKHPIPPEKREKLIRFEGME